MSQNLYSCRIAGAILGGCVVLFAGQGCRKHDRAASAVGNVAPSATTAPIVRPAAAMWIDGVSYRFPAARLVLSPQGDTLNATLCSDDPPAAINTNYRGNSFMIQMKLDITSVDELDNYTWKFVADSAADVDSNTGIFLDGTARQLQPTAISVAFHKRGDDLIADLDGQFQSLDTQNPAALRKPSAVTGRLYTQVISQP